MSQGYAIPADDVCISEEIKKSRFITYLGHTPGNEAARAFVQRIKSAHPDARHHCWAFVAGNPQDSQQLGFSDDGEPSGTAGKPMLSLLMGSGIGEITAVVVRYYGGIKLGTGGLVKAYGGGVQQALKQLPTQQKIPQSEYTLSCDYALLSQIESLIRLADGDILQSQFAEGVTLTLSLPRAAVDEVERKVRNLSRGELHLRAVTP